MRCVLDDDCAVDDDGGARACRVAVWVGVGRLVNEIFRVEQCHVGTIAFPEQAAIPELQRPCRPAGHLVDRLFQRNQALVAHIAADNARKGSIKPWMRHPLRDHAVIGGTVAVGANERGRRAHDRANIVFGDRGDQCAGRAVIGDQVITDLIDGVDAARVGQRGDGLPGGMRQFGRDRDLHSLPSRDSAQLFSP